jgi:UDP-2,4-diacetamido-2,4,6-trideoxy-beta-L-altropyranose hydrolase
MNLVIRADVSREIGTGHMMRCLALAQAWQDAGGQAIFVMAMRSPTIEARLRSERFEVVNVQQTPGSAEDAVQTEGVANQHNAQWIVVDGYQFDGNYQRKMKDSGRNLLFIDDYGHADHYCADIVLNQNLHAHENLYRRRETYTKLLLGTRIVLLRREFVKWQGWKREAPPVVRRILVTFGGGNDRSMTCKVIRALKQADLNGAEVTVIAGPTSPHLEVIRKELMGSTLKFHLLSAVDDMATLMASADIAISAAGSTCWELAFMGLPSLVLPLADNQVPIAEELNRKGVAIRLDAQKMDSASEITSRIIHLIRSHDTRSMMTEKGQKLVDGEGPERVLMHMRGETLRLRKVREADCKLLWEWVNDPEVRKLSFSTNSIAWEEHNEWWKSKMTDPNCYIFIGIDTENHPLGQIRFDVKDDRRAEIDVYVEETRRGCGYGTYLIDLGAEKMFRETAVKELHAFIRSKNQRSISAFERAKFTKAGTLKVRKDPALHFVRRRENIA